MGLCVILKSWRLMGIFIRIGFRAFVLVQVLVCQEKYYILASQTKDSSTLGHAKLYKVVTAKIYNDTITFAFSVLFFLYVFQR